MYPLHQFIYLLFLIGQVSAKGRIAVQLVSYNNSKGLDIKGQCCDGVNIPGCPVGKCDHVFDICIREPPGINRTARCVYGSAEINAEENKNVVTFPDGKSLFDFDVWKGGIEIFINVTDTDSGDVNVPVDYFTFDHYTTAAGYNSSSVSYDTFSLKGARNASATELVIKAKVYCDPHYYGTDCSINCVADNSCSGHYNCDAKGNKVCLPGWAGVNCTEQIPGGVADCSVYGGGDEFVPSLWEGFYVCPDNNQPQLFQLNITRTFGKINVNGQLKINSVVLSVAGTYGSLSRGLTLQANSLNGSQIVGSHNVSNIELNIYQRNETFMDGKLKYNDASRVICNVTTLNRKKAYFSGCNFAGVCIRYGTMKDEFYCCCRQGTLGPYCGPVTTTGPTTVTRPSLSTSASTKQSTFRSTPTSTTTSTTTITPSTTTKTTQQSTSSLTTSPTTRSTTQPTITTTPMKSTMMSTSTTVSSTSKPTTTVTPATTSTEPTTLAATTPTTSTSTTSTSSSTSSSTAQTTITSSAKPSTTSVTQTTFSNTTPSTAITSSTLSSTTSKATTVPTVTTTSPTTVPTTTIPTTTIKSTTRSTTPTIPSTTSPTTTKSTSTLSSTSTTTTPTTPRPTTATQATTTTGIPPQFTGNATYSFMIKLVQEEFDESYILAAIKNSWININKEQGGAQLNTTLLSINGFNWYEAIGDEGILFTYISYKMSLTSAEQGHIYVPSADRIERELNSLYRGEVKLYKGNSVYRLGQGYQIYINGPPPTNIITRDLEMIFLKLLRSKCNSTNCAKLTSSSISLKKTEEYVGDNGLEITKLYLFVEKNGVVVDKSSLPNPTSEKIDLYFKNNSLQLNVYRGTQKLRYRFHYQLLVKGHVYSEDIEQFKIQIQQVWYQAYIDLICRLCNVSVVRTEEYIGSKGELLTSVIYFFNLRQTVTVPVYFPAPSTAAFNSSLNISNPNGLLYELYTGKTYYRYRHRYSLLIKDMVDKNDIQKLVSNIQEAWNNISIAGKVTLKYTREKHYITASQEFLTELVCFVLRGNKILDARTLNLPATQISNWLHNHSKVVSRVSGQQYVLYTGLTSNIVRTDWLFKFYLIGYLVEEDKVYIQNTIKTLWQKVWGQTNVTVNFKEEETYMEQNNRDTVTKLAYAVYVNSKLLKAINIKNEITRNISTEFTTALASLTGVSRKYQLYNGNLSLLLNYLDVFHLHFTTKISNYQLQTTFSQGLLSSLKTSWKDYKKYNASLKVHVVFQEKIYINSKKVWRVGYFLTYNTKPLFKPFVSKISETALQNSFNLTSLKGVKYQLYTNNTAGFAYRWSYSLLFNQEVSVLDWIRIQNTIKNVWCQQHNKDCGNKVVVTIKEQEKYIDAEGKFSWKLIYFVALEKKLYDSRRYLAINSSRLDLNWDNVYHTRYSIALTSSTSHLWRYYYGFHLYTSNTLTIKQLQELKTSLLQAWYNMSLVSSSCKCLDVTLNRPRLIITENGERMWQLTYFLTFKSSTVDSSIWPSLNMSLVKMHFISNIDFYYYERRFKFYSSVKVSTQDYKKIEKSMLENWLNHTNNTEYRTCGCISIKIQSQEEIIDHTGKSHWLIHYLIKKNNQPLSPSKIRPFSWASFNAIHNLTDVHGLYYNFKSKFSSYTRYSFMGGLFIKNWIPPSQYGQFKQYLLAYYRKRYQGKNVTIDVSRSTKQFFSPDGSLTWHLPFQLKVNGKITYPSKLNTSEFESLINIITPNGGNYKLEEPKQMIDSRYYFSFKVSHKVSPSVYPMFKNAIKATWLKKFPEWKNKTLNISIGNQEEVVVNGKTAWKLHYSLTVDGKKFFWSDIKELNMSMLGKETTFKGPNGVGYSIVEYNSSSKVFSSKKMFSIYLNTYTTTSDINKIRQKIKQLWELKLHDNTSVDISFVQQKKYIDTNGKAVWKWDYSLAINKTRQYREAVPTLNINSVKSAIENLTSISGNRFHVLTSSSSYKQYNMHFPVYVSTKVSKAYFKEFKKQLILAWNTSHTGLKSFDIDITSQEELVKENGESVWKLVYFLKNNSKVVDARITQHLNISKLHAVTGPRGRYLLLRGQKLTNLLQQSYSKSVYLSSKLDTVGKKKLQTVLTNSIKKENKDLHGNIQVDIRQQEEYVLETGKRAWRIVYFVKVGGDYIPATSVKEVDQSSLDSFLNFTGPQSQNYTVVKNKSMYRYRHAFFLHFDTKVATKSFSIIRNKIIEAWKTSKTDYKTCNCLSIEPVDLGNLEEVLDKDGKYYWRLAYFMKRNSSIVESMTHIPLNISHINEQLKNVTNAKNKQYKTIDVSNKVILRTRLAFKLNLNLNMGYKDKTKFQQIIKETWKKMKPERDLAYFHKVKNVFHSNSTEVSIKRSMRYVDLKTKKTFWQIEYFLTNSEQIIDPLVLPKMNMKYLKDKLSFKNPREMEYQVITTSETVDYRWHFAVYLKKEVRKTDFRNFQSAVSLLWRKEYNKTASVTIVHQEEHIDSFGRSFWKLVTFVKEVDYIDSQVTADLDIAKLQRLTNFTGTDGSSYKLETNVPDTLKRYDISFSFFVSSAIKTQKINILSGKIKELWKNTGIWNAKDIVKIDIRKQDKYLTNEGLSYKVIYYLAVNEATLDSNQFQKTNSTKLKDILQSLSSTTEIYNLVEKTKVFRYEEQFSFLLTKPVLLTDKQEMEKQLQKAWIAKTFGITSTNVKVQILLQDELIRTNGKSLWKVLYTVTADNTTFKSTQEGELSPSTLNQHVNLTETGTNTKYTSYLDWTSLMSLKRYQELFVLYFSQRVEIKDYTRLSTKIKVLWNNTNGVTLVTGAKILKQEKVIDKKSNVVWSLLYSLETSNTQQIDNVLVSKPSFDHIRKTIQILSPLGKHYELVDVQKYYRLSQMFQVTINRRIYKKDMEKFSGIFKSFLQNTTKGLTWTEESNFALTKEDHVINTGSGENQWQYSFVVNVSGKIVDASMQQHVDIKTLQDKITFMSPRKETYELKRSDSVQMFSDRFQLNLRGRVKESKHQEIKNALKMVWMQQLNSGTVDIVSMEREEYIKLSTYKKETITKYSYFLKDAVGYHYPSLTRSANMALLATNVSEELYNGNEELQRFEDCYRFYLIQQEKSFNQTALMIAVEKAWKAHVRDNTSLTVQLIKKERYVGTFGIELATMLYTVKEDAEHFSPNYYVEPNYRVMETALLVTKVEASVYKASTTNAYRPSVLYEFSLIQESGDGITMGDKVALEGAVQKAWKSHQDFQNSAVKTEIVYNQQYVVSNNVTVNKLFYKMEVNATRIESWQKTLPNIQTRIQNNLDQISSIKDIYKVTLNNGLRVRVLYVKKAFDAVKLKNRLTASWKNKFVSNGVEVTILSSEKYSSTVWEAVNKIRYTVNVSGVNLTDDSYIPSYEEIDTDLKSAGMSLCGCKSSKLRKIYVFGTSASLKYTKIKQGLETLWRKRNAGATEVQIRVRNLSKRNRRDTSTPSYKLVGNNGEDIAPLEYAASVLDQEPNPMFVTQPNDTDLHKALTDVQAEPCGCKPKLAGNIKLDGKTKDGEKDKIKDAIKDAFAKSNPGMKKDDFDVELTDVNNDVKDSSGKPVSDVAYRVQRKDGGDVEHLVPPTRAHLESSLATAGKTLHSRAEPTASEEENWKIPVAVACAIVGFIIICVIIGYAVYMTRRSRKEDLLKREERVYNQNKFDAEHFSDPAMYENPAYMEGSAKDSKLSVL